MTEASIGRANHMQMSRSSLWYFELLLYVELSQRDCDQGVANRLTLRSFIWPDRQSGPASCGRCNEIVTTFDWVTLDADFRLFSALELAVQPT